MTKIILKISLLTLVSVPALMLSACGGSGDSHTEPYYGVPYTHERTAGTGVAYVRGKMLPPKETNTTMMEQAPAKVETTTTKTETTPPPPIEPPVTQGDKMFDSRQGK